MPARIWNGDTDKLPLEDEIFIFQGRTYVMGICPCGCGLPYAYEYYSMEDDLALTYMMRGVSNTGDEETDDLLMACESISFEFTRPGLERLSFEHELLRQSFSFWLN